MESLFSSAIVQLFLSLVIVWALFAIIVGIVHEAIVQILSERGRFLRVQLTRVLYDPANKVNWATLLYSKSILKLLTKDQTVQVSDMKPEIFARGLIKALVDSHIVAVAANKSSKNEQKNYYENDDLNKLKNATKFLKKSDLVQLIDDSLNKAELSATVNLATGLKNEGEIYLALINNIADWYTSLSDRMTSWYKKKTKGRLFALGFICALIFNVNSITITKYLLANPNARKGIISYYQHNQTKLDSIAHRYDTLRVDTSKKISDSLKSVFDFKINERVKDSIKAVTNALKIDSLIKADNIPIGWSAENPYRYCSSFLQSYDFKTKSSPDFFKKGPPKGTFPWVKYILYLLLGTLITGFAASTGAPFWFDVLKKTFSYKNITTK